MKQILHSNRSGALYLRETPVPLLEPHGVLVETSYSAVSAGTEGMKVRLARKSLLKKARARPDLVAQVVRTYRREGISSAYRKVMNRLEAELPLGYSLAGRVVDVAEGIDDVRVGDYVAGAGSGYANHAEFAFIPRNLCAVIPTGVSLDEAAFTTIAAIALHGVRQADTEVGDAVCVVGLGLVGLIAVQIFAAAGARVFGADLNPDRVALARKLGALDSGVPTASGFDQQVLRFSSGRGFDRVMVAAADPGNRAIGLAARLARDRARLVILGIVGMDLDYKVFYDKELELRMSRSYGPGRYDEAYERDGLDYPLSYVRWTEQRNLEAVLDMLVTGRLTLAPLITHRVPFADAPSAYAALAAADGASSTLGVVFDYGTPGKPIAHRVDLPHPATAGISRVGVGVVGAGNFARTMLLPAFTALPDVVLTGAVRQSSAGASQTAKQFRFQFASTAASDVFADPATDLVVIATRHDRHAALACEALEAGKAVMVEKPLALNAAELADVIHSVRQARRPFLHVGFNRRFAPMIGRARAALPARGPYSLLYRVNAGFVPRDHWYHDPLQGGGRLVGEVCHFLDLFCAITAAVPVRVTAESMHDSGVYHGDNLFITTAFADGSVGTIVYLACNDSALPKERIEISAAGTSVIIDDFRTLQIASGGRLTSERRRFKQDKGHVAEVKAVVDALKHGNPAPIPVRDLVTSMLLTFAAVRSLQEHQSVSLDVNTFEAILG